MARKEKTTADETNGSEFRDLNFKVTPDFHRHYKVTASASGISMKQLLEQSFDAWIDMKREDMCE